MDPFNKFYSAILPILRDHSRELYRLSRIEILAGRIALKCFDVYRRSILKDKHNLDIDLTKTDIFAVPGATLSKKVTPCEICGESRVLHLCHIIPRSLGGNSAPENLLTLCANHHHLFDRHILTADEWKAINWEYKVDHVKKYAFSVRYKHHVMGWNYKFPGIPGCGCGSVDFSIVAGYIICINCGDQYSL